MRMEYADGWDPVSRVAGRELSAGEARERDAAGLTYAVLHRVPGRALPAVVRRVSWRSGLVEVWAYDEQGRRTFEADLSMLVEEDRLLNRRLTGWQYPGPATAESAQDCPRTVVEIASDGTGRIAHRPTGVRGSSLEAELTVPEDQCWSARPAFGGWRPFTADDHLPQWVREHLATAGTPEAPVSWRRVPSPMETSVDFGRLFQPGMAMASPYGGVMTSTEPRPAGTLCLPGGLLGIGCPAQDDEPRLVLAVPPGEYRLDEAQAAEEGERAEGTAVRVHLGEGPAVSWEMLLGPGDDPWLLREGEAYGFGTDAAMGAFADAGAWRSLQRRFVAALHDHDDEGWTIGTDSDFFLRTREPGSGVGLAGFGLSSDGVHPVWLGRSSAGEPVAAVVLLDGVPELWAG
ncbi:DUF4241 domain-containing protein [Streptomyces spororaveus]|uniref:DUF4241 domain-containing protein n=1 Tax=Streptomyces spororaveus TaxID=284039 RepID=UPI0020798077|nr:DUF4241 domain-containing protein [Streptomyces spororaveus]MCM9080119.1 DUF4241 domain-containing protein [Streptomyces spororaveus]